jgi:RNA polymerase sigma factor (TIGR02999 family)
VASPSSITLLLQAQANGEAGAAERLFPLIYRELHRLAHRQLESVGRPGRTLNTTALVHEAYLKLIGQSRVSANERAHFFSLVARAMRQIIIDFARRHMTGRRGGGLRRIPLEEAQVGVESEAEALVLLDQAMQRLGELDPRLVEVVECRFFAGLTEEETANTLGIGVRTVQRDWLRARGWLKSDMGLEV